MDGAPFQMRRTPLASTATVKNAVTLPVQRRTSKFSPLSFGCTTTHPNGTSNLSGAGLESWNSIFHRVLNRRRRPPLRARRTSPGSSHLVLRCFACWTFDFTSNRRSMEKKSWTQKMQMQRTRCFTRGSTSVSRKVVPSSLRPFLPLSSRPPLCPSNAPARQILSRSGMSSSSSLSSSSP